MVGGRLVGGSVVPRFEKKTEKSMFGIVIAPVHFDQGLFCYSNFNFFYIADYKK